MSTSEEIVKNIQSNKLSSLYSDVKSILGHSKNDSFCVSLCQVLKALCKHVISLDKCSKELSILEPSIRLCLDHLQKHYQSELLKKFQLDRILYYIITSFIKSKLYESAQYIAECLKEYLKDLSIFTIEDSTLAVIKNVSIIIWNAALEYEQHSSEKDKHILALQFRSVGLDFMLMDKQCKETVVDKVCIALQKYWIDNPNHDMFQCLTFFKKIWAQMLVRKIYISDQVIFFKLCYYFNNFLLRYGRRNEFFMEVITCLELLYKQLVLEEEKKEEVLVFINILKYCIKVFAVKSSTTISPKTFSLWMMTFKALHTSEDSTLLYNTLHIFHMHFSDCASCFNLSQLSDDIKEFLKIISINFNVLELLVNEYLKLSSVELHKDPTSLLTCKIRISGALIRFYHLVLQNEPDKKKLFRLSKKACQFVDQSFLFLNCKTLKRSSEEERAFFNFGITVYNFGKMFYKSSLYEEAAQLLLISIAIDLSSSEIKDKDNYMLNLWTKQELLIYSYLLLHDHQKALDNAVKALSIHENKTKECLELWMKIKRDVLRFKDTTMASKTISDVISETGISFTTEKIVLLLIEELKYCKMERCNIIEEMQSVANKLLAMPCTGIIRAHMLFEMVYSSLLMKKKFLLLNGKGSLELCQEAIKLYREYLVKNSSDGEIKLKLSVMYFWFHVITFRQMFVVIETEAKKETPPSPVNETKVPINDDEDDTCDIQPGIQFVTLSVETKALENLDHAFQLWTEISLDSHNLWMQLKDIVKDLGILDVIQASAQTFATAVHDLKEWRLYVLLLEVAIATGSKIHELTACTSLIKFAVRLGYLKIADHFVSYGLALLKSEAIDEKHIFQKLRFSLAQSSYYLHVEKFNEGLEILKNVLTDSIFDYQSTKSSKLLKSEILLVLSHYLALPESTFSNRQNFRSLSSSTTSLNAANECALICQGLYIYESSEENQNSDVLRSDSLYYKPRLMHTLLQSHLFLGQLFIQIGAPREARYYLQQGLVIAQPHILTYWCSKFLTILGQLDLLCDNPKDCTIKLNGLKHIMNNELKETIAAVLLRHYKNIEVTEQPTSPEESFIRSKPELDDKRKIKQKFTEKYDNVFASPVARRRKNCVSVHKSLDEYITRGLFSLQFARFEIYMLKSLQLITEGSIEASIDELKRTLLEYEILYKSNALSEEISLVKSNLIRNLDNVQRTPQEIDAHIIIYTSIQLSIIYSSSGKLNEANDQINHAHQFLQSLAESPKILYHNLYCLVKYRGIITSIKSLISSKGHTRVEYQLFPVKKRIQFMQSKISNKNSLAESLLQTPKCLPVPKIYVTDFTTSKLCHAPTKKDVLPAHIKQDLDSPNLDVPQTPTFTPLYFSSSEGDDSAFVTPKISEARNKKTLRSKRLVWNKSSKAKKSSSTDDKIDYKFFKSKSTNTISSSGDVWRLPISNMPSEIKQCSSSSVRTTRSSRSTTKNEISHPFSGLTKAPQKKLSRAKKLVQSTSIEIYDDEKSKVKNQFRESRTLIKHTSESVERARSSSRGKREDCSQDSSDEDNNHIISDFYESDVFGKSKSSDSGLKEVTSLFNDLCNDFGSISVSNEDSKERRMNTNAVIGSQESDKKTIKNVLSGEKVKQFIKELSEIRSLMQHNPTFPLYSDICKLLAFLIITEPSDHPEDFEEQMLKSGFLLSETFAITLRHHFISTVMKKVKKGEQSFEGQLLPTVQDTGHALPEMMKSMIKALPEDWTIVQISTFAEKEAAFDTGKRLLPKLIVCQYRKNTLPAVCCIDHTQDDKFTSSFFEDFEDIQKQNVLIMSNKEKNMWWKSRITLNKHLKELSDCMENIWLGCWKGLLLGLPTDEETIQSLKNASDEIMKIAPTKNKQLLQAILESASFLRRDQISEAVCYLWECTPFDDIYSKICNSIYNLSSSIKQCERHPVILILDKDIQVLPWECMPILKDVPVSRVPSMSLLMSQLNTKSFSKVQSGVDRSQTFYILNPSGDLSDTQGRFEDNFKRQSEWNGIAGRVPTTKEYLSAFENNEIFIYCGHGSGRAYLEGTSIDRVRCNAATVLMGCSSGRLKQLGRQFEPQGIAFRYWLNGSPCVVANLWDVTDKDIDKFTEEFLSMWMPNYKTDNSSVYNVSKATSVSRKACKLKYLIGAAPVVFGLPVFVRK